MEESAAASRLWHLTGGKYLPGPPLWWLLLSKSAQLKSIKSPLAKPTQAQPSLA